MRDSFVGSSGKSKETLGQLSDIYDVFFEDRGVLLSTYSAFGLYVYVKSL